MPVVSTSGAASVTGRSGPARRGGRRSASPIVAGSRIVAARIEFAAKRGLQRAGDDLLGVRVVPQVGRIASIASS